MSFLNEKILPNKKGVDIIKHFSKILPSNSGVYQMESSKGEILYIGKAKNLAKRVVSYSSLNNLSRRLKLMISLTSNLSFTITNTEIEALLLECSLIKRHRPRFNVILRDDKSFPYVMLNKEHNFPRVLKYRGAKKNNGEYFGPFVSPHIADFTLISLQKIFLLRSCSDNIFRNRKRPCLLYDIKRCSAPCVGKISESDYAKNIKDAKNFLFGKTENIKKKLNKLMKISSNKKMYEDAARLRDRIKSINQIQKYQSVYIKDMQNIDIFAIKVLENKSCIYGMFFRNGSNYGNKAFFPLHEIHTSEIEILESFLFQFYSNKDTPPKILVNLNTEKFKHVEKILAKKNNKRIKIIKPVIGEKIRHIKLAEKNAIENLKINKNSYEKNQIIFGKLQTLLSLKDLPNRIEVYDNSHTFGSQPVGVMIVFDKQGFNKSHYRKFKIRYDIAFNSKSNADDYYMTKEVLTRRFKKIENNLNGFLPDIIIIDGGKGHLNVANEIIKKKQLKSIALLGVAKGKERNKGKEILITKNDKKILRRNDSLLLFIQKIRDEAHRFAITFHRQRRQKNSIKSIFNEIEGIGPKKKKSLILEFLTVKNISNATINELNRVPGINKDLAKRIYNFFHSQ